MYALYESEQTIFDRSLNALFLAAKILFKIILYFPILFTGYWFATNLLTQQDTAALWIAAVLLIAYGLYCGVYCLKGILLACRQAGNLLWLPIFVVCIAYTCITPAYFLFQTMEPVMLRLSPDAGSLFTWMVAGGSALYLYYQYNFLREQAPAIAWPAYWLGIQLVQLMTRLKA